MPTDRVRGLIVCALGLLACATSGPPGATPIEAAGEWKHAPSGLLFPENVGEYRRVAINRYDRQGMQIAVGYNYESPSALVAFTVYVTPPETLESGNPVLLAEQFEMEKKVIHDVHSGAQESWVRDETFLTADGRISARSAEFRFTSSLAHRRQPVISQLYLLDFNGWFVKYRLTFPASQETLAREVADFMLHSAPWARRAA